MGASSVEYRGKTQTPIYRLKSRMGKGHVALHRRGKQFHEFKLRVPIQAERARICSIPFFFGGCVKESLAGRGQAANLALNYFPPVTGYREHYSR